MKHTLPLYFLCFYLRNCLKLSMWRKCSSVMMTNHLKYLVMSDNFTEKSIIHGAIIIQCDGPLVLSGMWDLSWVANLMEMKSSVVCVIGICIPSISWFLDYNMLFSTWNLPLGSHSLGDRGRLENLAGLKAALDENLAPCHQGGLVNKDDFRQGSVIPLRERGDQWRDRREQREEWENFLS